MKDKNTKLNEFLSGKKVSRFQKIKASIFETTSFLRNSNIAHVLKTRILFWRIPRYKKIIFENFPFTFFVLSACYIAYRMEKHNDDIKRMVQFNKTIKQEQVDLEDEALRNIMQDPRNVNYNKQIREVQRRKK
jgi:hypothetical protein